MMRTTRLCVSVKCSYACACLFLKLKGLHDCPELGRRFPPLPRSGRDGQQENSVAECSGCHQSMWLDLPDALPSVTSKTLIEISPDVVWDAIFGEDIGRDDVILL